MKSRRNKGPKTNTGVSYKKNKRLERQKNSANCSKNKLSWQKNAHHCHSSYIPMDKPAYFHFHKLFYRPYIWPVLALF